MFLTILSAIEQNFKKQCKYEKNPYSVPGLLFQLVYLDIMPQSSVCLVEMANDSDSDFFLGNMMYEDIQIMMEFSSVVGEKNRDYEIWFHGVTDPH